MQISGLFRTLSQPISRLSLRGWQAYLFATGMIGLAMVMRWVLPEALGSRVPFPTFFLAVFLSAWVGGWGAGLFASCLTIVCGMTVFPITRPPWDWRDLVALGFVFSVCVVGAYACARLRASMDVIEKDRAWCRRVLEGVGDAVLVIDEAGRLRYFNRRAAELWNLGHDDLGCDADEAASLWVEGNGHRFGDLSQLVREIDQHQELPPGLEVRTSGRAVPVAGNVSRFQDPEYGAAAVVSVQSIHALREAARQVESVEKRMRALFESDIVGLFSIDGRGRIIAINQAMLRLLDYAEHGQSGPDNLDQIADDTLLALLGVGGSENAIAFGPFDCRLIDRRRDPVWVSLGVVPISLRERMVFVTDIRARKRAESELFETEGLLQILVDQVPALVSFVSPGGRIVLVNRHYQEFVGAACEGQNWRTGLTGDVVARVSEHVPRVLAGEPSAFTLEVPGAHDGGDGPRHLQVHLVPYQSVGRERSGIVVYAYDITERLRREEEIARSEARFRHLAEASSAVVWQACASGTLTAQIGWSQFTGAPALPSFDHWLEWVHSDDVAVVRTLVDALHSQREGCEAEFRLRHVSGGYRYVSVRAVVLEGRDRGGTEWIGTIRDIHQRRLAESALASKESELRLILDAVPARIAYMNVDGLFQWANANYIEWFGVRGDIKGRAMDDVMPQDVVATLYQPLEVARRGFVSQLEWQENNPTYGPRWTTTTFSPDLDEQGRVRGVISLCMDSTERHETEDALRRSDAEHRTLAENVPHMVWMSDAEGRLQYCNSRWHEYTGQDDSGHWTGPMHPGDRQAAEAAFREAAQARAELNLEVRYTRADDGARRWHLVRALPLLDEEGRVLRWYGTCTDIEDQKAAQETLREAHSRTTHFLATLSHELRNPLAALMASSEVLDHAMADPGRLRDTGKAIQRQAWHLKRLTDDLLDISRITLGRIQMTSSVIDLREICRDVCHDFSEKADGFSIRLDCKVPDDPILVTGDPSRIRQCVDNLVSNAIKASAPQMTVHVETRIGERFAEIIVRDEGVGIEPDSLSTIFLPFSQGDDWRHRGLGLGLSIVSKLVELHGGSVWVESQGKHRGSVFGIRLPLVDGKTVQRPVRVEAPAEQSLAGKVLIVDDETDNAVALQYLLSLDGHHVFVAEDGLSALTLAESVQPDVVICDLGLPPPLNGLEVARRLRELRGPGVHLCAYSGYGSKEDIQRSMASGFDAHLTKPGTPRSIADEVARGLARVKRSRDGKSPSPA